MAKKKKYIVLPRNGKIFQEGLTTGRGHRKFKKAGAMWITDEAEAREIDHQYGMKGSRQVAVTTDQQYEWSANNENGDGRRMDNIHHYTFQGVSLKQQKKKVVKGVPYVWKFGKWRKAEDHAIEKRTLQKDHLGEHQGIDTVR